MQPEFKRFHEAMDRAAKVVGSDNRLAGALDVSRQALLTWRKRGTMPLLRAHQTEKLTGVAWQDLAPDAIQEIEKVKSLPLTPAMS